MKRISQYPIFFMTILALVLTSCTANGTSKLDAPTAVPALTETRAAPALALVVRPMASAPAIELVPYASDIWLYDLNTNTWEKVGP